MCPIWTLPAPHDAAAGTVTFFAVNRHPTEDVTPEIALHGFGDLQVIDHQVMTHADLGAVNSLTAQSAVTPAKGTGAKIENGSLTLALRPHSYTMIRLGRR